MENNQKLDATDKQILRMLQTDAEISLDAIAKEVNLSKTPCWARIKRLKASGIITKTVALINAESIGLKETVYVAIRTAQHNAAWLEKFTKAVQEMPEILEAMRLAGEMDYILKIKVKDTRDYDKFYKKLVTKVNISNVTSMFVMEHIKQQHALAIE